MMNELLTAIELFSGAGGLLLALKQANFNVLFANEINSKFAKTHIYNFPEIPLVEMDINNLDKQSIDNYLQNQFVDLVAGGPPCQGFSIFGKRRFVYSQGYDPQSDLRNHLVYQYMRIVQETKPLFFFMENVKGFLSLDKGLFVEEVKKQFEAIGYKSIWCGIVCAADYGVPQERYRMFMIGNRIGKNFVPPAPTHSAHDENQLPLYRSVGDSIMDLVDKGCEIPNHVALQHKPTVAERMGHVPEGGRLNINVLPEHLLKATRRDSKTGKVSNYSHVYRRLDRKKPSNTMVPGHNAFPIHPTLNRTLTAREAARLQSFPDSHVFFGTRQEQCIQVGNAVPPDMALPFLNEISHLISDYYKEKAQK